jgi:hypothetical protein
MTDWAVYRKRIGKHVSKRSRIGTHCYATLLVLRVWFTERSVTLTVDSRYPRQRIIESTATKGRDKLNCWERSRIFGWPKGGGVEYLHRDPASRRRQRREKSQIWDSKIWPRVLRVGLENDCAGEDQLQL